MTRGIFIAATGQHIGKTTLCLGILAGLLKIYNRVGFIKPVGQKHIFVNNQIPVDKDAVLFHEYFRLNIPYTAMSPVIIPAGMTREFLDGLIDTQQLKDKITDAYDHISSNHDFTLSEGTGHVGVGSIIDLNNADVASLLGLEAVLIASGGLGSAFDALAVNCALFHAKGVKIKGVILNRVLNEKREMIINYFQKALNRWNIPLIGAIPYEEMLAEPSILDFETLFETKVLVGEKQRFCHFHHLSIVDTSMRLYRQEKLLNNQLIITPASREDLILATLAKVWDSKLATPPRPTSCALLLTGPQPPRPLLVEKIKRADLPCLYTSVSSYKAMQMISSFTAKIRQEDLCKVELAIQLVESHVDFSLLTS